jgi:hypothetical protein
MRRDKNAHTQKQNKANGPAAARDARSTANGSSLTRICDFRCCLPSRPREQESQHHDDQFAIHRKRGRSTTHHRFLSVDSAEFLHDNNNNVFSSASRTRLRSCLETVAARHTTGFTTTEFLHDFLSTLRAQTSCLMLSTAIFAGRERWSRRISGNRILWQGLIG